ncbi:ATP-dependent helicase [Streptomyces specialis]|uniref:ATP-dependent helicase n=1 Tax=Streptomyces specialis TaxID=498367 RepID=UPI000B1A7BC2|nr:ATP-dependent helicase [Streptomyces specialis]
MPTCSPPPAAGGGGGERGRPPARPAEPVSARPAAPAGPPGAGGLDGLDAEQAAAVAVTEGPLLIVAGPGTGKTRTLTHRVARLVTEHGVAPEHCLALTFTRRAAEEMGERLAALLPGRVARPTIATFHSLGLSILREQHERVGLSAEFGIADEARQAELLAAEGADGYRAALRRADLVDFDDLIALPLELLETDEELTAAYRDRHRWISVDEYQDVDERQYRLLRRLAPPDGNLTAIGDPDQAIYGFRGADVGFFLRFREDFPTARTVSLTRNYRSSARVLAAAAQVIAPATLVPGRELLPLGDHGDAPVTLHAAASEAAEATFVARTVEELLGGASFHARDSGWAETAGSEGLGFSDFAVLYRTDRQAGAVAEALARVGLPFRKRSHDRLADRPGVARAVAALDGGDLPLAGQLAEVARRAKDDAEVLAAVELLLPLAERCGGDQARFRDELALGVEADSWDPRADRISLLTLHAAKGLEFPVVFVVGCENGLLPLRMPGAEPDPEGDAEERRLLFVGVTRAQRHLYLSYAAERLRHGRVRPAGRSPFLDGLTDVARVATTVPRRRTGGTQLKLM